MKYLHKLTLVPLATLLLAGCSGPAAIQSSTETDDLYYASTDKTVFASKPTAAVTEKNVATESNSNPDEVANPEYSGTTKNNRSNNDDSYSDYDYYSEDYTYASRIRRFNSPYRGMSYYDFAYTDPYWYGSGFNAYNPFYDPFSYGYGSGFYRPGFYTGLSIGLGWGNPFFSPYAGYGNFYNPYGFGGGGLFGYRNGFNNGYYNGFYNGFYANRGNYDRYPTNYRPRNYGPRGERSVVPVDRNNAGGRIAPGTGGNRVVDANGGRPARVVNGGGVVAPNTGNAGGVVNPGNVGSTQGRAVRGARTGVVNPVDAGTVVTPNTNQPARVSTDNNNVYRPSTRPIRRFEGTISNDAAAPVPPSFPAETQRQSRPARVIESQPRTVETPRYEAPRRENRNQEIFRSQPAPQRNDSWSQPSRSSSPSYSPPSNNGGGSSGGGRPRRN